jgi:hypothetical protein
MDKNERTLRVWRVLFMSTDQLIYFMSNIKKRGQGGGAFQDAEDLVFVLSASLVIESMS